MGELLHLNASRKRDINQSQKKSDLNSGHRARLREKLLASQPNTIADYELLEMLLFAATPRQDTKPLAKMLLSEFGSFAKAITAPMEKLLNLEGVGASVLANFKLAREVASRLAKAEIADVEVISSWDKLIEYCRINMGHLDVEQFRVLYLNKKNHLISDEAKENGTLDQVSVYPREVLKRALFLNASAVILIHNHPSGEVEPSRGDIEVTQLIEAALRPIDVQVYDHIIVSKQGYYSFRSEGLL